MGCKVACRCIATVGRDFLAESSTYFWGQCCSSTSWPVWTNAMVSFVWQDVLIRRSTVTFLDIYEQKCITSLYKLYLLSQQLDFTTMQPQFFMEWVELILDLQGAGAVLTCTEIQQDVYLQKTKECLHYKTRKHLRTATRKIILDRKWDQKKEGEW